MQHGSESYFVLGEGLLARAEVATPRAPRRGGRAAVSLLAHGPERQRTTAQRPEPRKVGEPMTAGGGGASKIPAGFTYLGQFVDHDLTFDKTT